MILLAGQMLNTVFPARLGDLTRAYVLGGKGPGRSFVLGTVVLEKILDSIPMKRVAKPVEIAQSILWLCSDEAAFMTGQCLTLDGGLCA